ncbi:MAG: Flp pilus assembly complex ATPase component, partial [Chloroflexi bacterium]|nr:Flp pilus assembly complex ATPase component [Chloroflexota bacterium]
AMLKAGSTGHPGIGTIHAPDCQTAIRNLENRANEHKEAVASAVRAMLANATVPMVVIHIVNPEGRRHVTTIEEVLPSGGDTGSGGRYPMQLLWEWNEDSQTLRKRYPPSGEWARGVQFPGEGDDFVWRLPE